MLKARVITLAASLAAILAGCAWTGWASGGW